MQKVFAPLSGEMEAAMFQYIEGLYLITAGPVLTIIAAIGLRQITVAKNNAQIVSKRESFKLASEQIKYYLTDITPSINDLQKFSKENNISVLMTPGKTEIKDDKTLISFKMTKEYEPQLLLAATQCTGCLNKMESFAFPFISGIASETVAYSSVGKTFLHSVSRCIPVLVLTGDGHYENIKKLYDIWYRRSEKERLQNQINGLNNKIKNIKVDSIQEIGINNNKK